jgi:hypothetical protein
LLSLVGTWFVAKVIKVHIVQESMLLKGEMEAMVLENYLDPNFELMTKARACKGAS